MSKSKKVEKSEYDVITKVKLSETRNVVISGYSKGGYTVAQQLKTKDEDGNEVFVFLKGAIHVNDIAGLYDLRDAINDAIISAYADDDNKNTETDETDDECWD